jgi:predicted HTH transcriptional regulator
MLKKQKSEMSPRMCCFHGALLAEKDGAVVPTNAYALLTGRAQVQPVVQCGVFKGTDRAYFVDRREFEGSVQDQMEAAFQYVLEKIIAE